MIQTFHSARRRPTPIDCHTRLLLDPYLCVGPGCETHAGTMFAIAQQSAALGITLCVERQAWLEAAQDPDVQRRRVDLTRFEPIAKLDPLPVPSERDTGTLFMPARNETDIADLKLLGALHARIAGYVVALDGRLHRLAARAGLGSRVLTPDDALSWLSALNGTAEPVVLREIDPRQASASGRISDLVRQECEPFDPYLRARLDAGRGRVLASFTGGEPLAIGVVEAAAADDRLELVALAAAEWARGARVFEPIISAALAIARRRGVMLDALLPPHEEMVLRLLEDLGFEHAGRDAHGRERLAHAAEPRAPRLAGDMTAWVLSLDAAAHDHLLPELSGAPQAQLFAVGSDSPLQTLGSPLRKQVLLGTGPNQPARGDLLLFFHARASGRPASASLTCIARIDASQQCSELEEVLALNASRPGQSLAEIRSRLAVGPVTVLDVTMLGRLERFLPLAWLKEQGVLSAAPRGLRRLDRESWECVSGRLLLA